MLYRYIMTLIVLAALPFYSNAASRKLGKSEARARAGYGYGTKPLTNRPRTNTPALPSEPCLIAPLQPQQQAFEPKMESSAQESQAPAQLPQPISKRSVDVGRTGCLRPGSRESSEMNTPQVKEYVPQQPTEK